MQRPWTFLDFVWIWLGGLLGTGVAFAVGFSLDDADLLIVLALAGQYLGNILVFLWIRRAKQQPSVGFEVEGVDFLYVGVGLFLQIVTALLMLPLVNWLFPDGRPAQEIAETIANADSTLLIVSLIAAAVVLAPVTEELLFRGVLLRALERISKTFAVVVTALLFAGVHLLGLNIDDFNWVEFAKTAVVVMPPLFVLGVILARLTQRSGRLGPAIFLHSGWNLLAAVVLLLPQDLVG